MTYITNIIYITHITYMTQKTKKVSKESLWKIPKSFWRVKRQKTGWKKARESYQNFTEAERKAQFYRE